MVAAVHPVRYTIVPLNTAAHLFRVTCTVTNPDPSGQKFFLPAWIPGSYMIREFAKNIVELWAECDGNIIACQKIDKMTWQCEPVQGALTVTCDIHAWDNSVRAAHLDNSHGYFNGTSVFLAVAGRESMPCHVRLLRPAGAEFSAWRVATTLRTAPDTARWDFGDYHADNYDELIDHPVEMGTFSQARFEACGVPHDIVITGTHRADLPRLCRDLEKICTTQIRFFGDPAPMDRYLFLVAAVSDGYGGLEHRASTSLITARDDLPLGTDDPVFVKEGYRQFLGLCSHEYFHTWHVKRIKPAAFLSGDLAAESYTQQLWAFEGITSYYDDLLLLRAGVISAENYLELLGKTITRVLRTPGRFRQSIAESSFDAWTKFYRPDENSPNAIVSYYTKGALVALAIDLEIRRRTQQACSLDDVMRLLWQRHGLTGVGVEEDGIQAIAEEVCGSSLADFFAQAVYGTDDLDITAALAQVGVTLKLRIAEGQADNGGKPGRGDRPWPSLDIHVVADAVGARIKHCFDGGAAMVAGLSAGDVIVAINGLRATHGNIEKLVSAHAVGDAVSVHAFRRDELQESRVILAAAQKDTCFLVFQNGKPGADAMRWLENKS